MPMILRTSGDRGRSEERAYDGPTLPKGQHAITCCDIIDMGEMPKYEGEGTRHCIKLAFATGLYHEDGQHKVITTGPLTYSLNKKATLRRLLEDWTLEEFEDDKEVDIERLCLGRPALATIFHNTSEKNGRTYANIKALTALPDGMNAPSIDGYIRRSPNVQRLADDKLPQKVNPAQVTKWKAMLRDFRASEEDEKALLSQYNIRTIKDASEVDFDPLIKDLQAMATGRMKRPTP